MSESAIQAAASPAAPVRTQASEPIAPPSQRQFRRRPWHWLHKVLSVAASLRVTVVLFALAILLIFFGTLAQVDAGIWSVVSRYFRCFIAWIPLKIFFPRGMREVPGAFPFPGGWLIAGLLLINLLAAHAVRFRLTWKRSGVLVLHAGLIVMIVGEFITGLFAVESRMTIVSGKSANYLYDLDKTELAFTAHVEGAEDKVISIPASLLKKQRTIEYDGLPFTILVDKYLPNSTIVNSRPEDWDNPATTGIGLTRFALTQSERNGVDPEGTTDQPSAYITLVDRATGKKLGSYLFSTSFSFTILSLEPQKVSASGKTYDAELRFKRTYTPYALELHEVSTEFYPDTKTAKSFVSRVRLTDPAHDVDREETISMNAPMRYAGQTFYQASVIGENKITVLQVVRNPGASLPYVSCALVAVGMLVHFGIQLITFLRRRAAA